MQTGNTTLKIITTFIILSISISSCSIFNKSNKGDTAKLANENPEIRTIENASHFNPSNHETEIAEENDASLNSDTATYMDSFEFNDTLIMFSNKKLNNQETANILIHESPIVKVLDSLANVRFFNDNHFITDRDRLNVYNYALNEVPTFNDSVLESRINRLNRKTPFELTYNKTVKSFIDLYAVNKRSLSSRILGLSELYFPMFEEILDAYDLPLELKYLAVVESALVPNAGSRAGAKGLWQFMYQTGKVYDLQVNSFVDDRYDPYKSTVAAAQHLRDLYDIYQNWSLVLAAYNSGAGNVNKAIRRAGGVRSYWAIWPYLPRETRGYVPAFIAVYYVMNYAPEHNLYPVDPGILYNGVDTVQVKDVLSFDQISEFLNIPYNDVKFLNPSFKEGIIPADSENLYTLRLPREYIGEFVSNEHEIYKYKTQKGIEKDKLLAQIEQAKQRNVHVVRSGETLGHIARTYHTSVSNLQSWNNLKGSTIYPGQKLTVYANPNGTSSAASNTSTVQRSGEKSYHTVKNGENLGLIAKKYKCSTTDLKNWNNLKNSTIFPNQKIIVYEPTNNTKTELVKTNDGDVKYVIHVVKTGDTLWDIAKQYDGVTVNQIKALNNITNSRRLKPGQKLKVAVSS
ncbi:MAG: LysM peptidoglycan-binding domain-containing protein [Bacteroidales bacterium]|nr:LysM peptidoglycan-binding domain-containing protein [Bacteroidales bacterium]